MVSYNTLIIILNTIPNELTLRNHPNTLFVGIGLFIGFLLIAFAKLARSDVYSTLIVSLLKVQPLQAFIKESHPINSREFVLLLINYLLSFGLVIFIFMNMSEIKIKNELTYVGLIPVITFIWPILCMTVIGVIIGERHVFAEPLLMKYIGAQFIGVLYFIVALVWTINSIPESLFINLVLWIYIGESVFRIFKSMAIVYMKGVSWYYIILYLCTLEILPLFVIVYYIMHSFIY